MLFGPSRAQKQILAELRVINQQQVKIMTALDDLKAAAARIESGVDSAEQKLDADGAQIKQLTAQLAALPPAGSGGTSDADVKAVTDQLNSIADGLSGHLDPVADAANAVTTAASSAAKAP